MHVRLALRAVSHAYALPQTFDTRTVGSRSIANPSSTRRHVQDPVKHGCLTGDRREGERENGLACPARHIQPPATFLSITGMDGGLTEETSTSVKPASRLPCQSSTSCRLFPLFDCF